MITKQILYTRTQVHPKIKFFFVFLLRLTSNVPSLENVEKFKIWHQSTQQYLNHSKVDISLVPHNEINARVVKSYRRL